MRNAVQRRDRGREARRVAADDPSRTTSGGLPDDMQMKLVERGLLFKGRGACVGEESAAERDGVAHGRSRAGFSRSGSRRHPLERLEILREAGTAPPPRGVRRAGLYREIWRAFVVLPAIRSVSACRATKRTSGYPIVIRAVTSDDAMTADWARPPYGPDRDHLVEHRERD